MLKLKGKRVEKGLTQSDMAKLINMEVPTYSRKERGIYRFRLDEIIKILEVLDCKFEDIFLPDVSSK